MSWWSEEIQGNYPPATIFDYKGKITFSELQRFARIILTEGVPHAYSQFPMAFEFARGKAAEILGIHPKQLSIVGSARIGYSLAPKKFGHIFDLQKSDIDLFAVSSDLFSLIVNEHQSFIHAFANGSIRPRHPLEQQFWESSRLHDPSNIKRGFLDSNHIPTFDQFPIAQRIGEAAFRFHANLEFTTKKKIGRKASIRVYKDWDSAVRQIAQTLKGALEHRDMAVAD